MHVNNMLCFRAWYKLIHNKTASKIHTLTQKGRFTSIMNLFYIVVCHCIPLAWDKEFGLLSQLHPVSFFISKSNAGVTLIYYECGTNDLTVIFSKSKVSLTKKLNNEI